MRCHHAIDVDADKNGWTSLSRDGNICWPDSFIDNEHEENNEAVADAALLKFEFPDEFHDVARFSLDDPVVFDHWNGCGYPRAGAGNSGRRELTGMTGEVIFVDPENPVMELGEKYAPKTLELWKGGSGSPVFVSNRIVGILTATPASFEGRRLYAVRIAHLSQNDDFRREIGWDERKERIRQLQEVVEEELYLLHKNSSEGCCAISKEFNLFTTDRESMVQPLAETLDSLPFTDVADRFRGVIIKLDQKKSAEKEIVWKLLHRILPLKCDPELVKYIRSKKSSEQNALVQVDIATETKAELVMAKLSSRNANYRVRKTGYPTGVLNLSHSAPPTRGIDPAGRGCEDGFHQYLLDKFGPDLKQADIDHFNCFLQDAWQMTGNRAEPVSPECQQLLANRLQRFSTDSHNPRTSYMTCDTKILPEKVICKLKQVYSTIVFLELTNDYGLLDHEEDELHHLFEMLHSRPGEDHDK